MKSVTVIAPRINRYVNGEQVTVENGEKVDMEDDEAAKFVRLGVVLPSEDVPAEQAVQPVPAPKPAPPAGS